MFSGVYDKRRYRGITNIRKLDTFSKLNFERSRTPLAFDELVWTVKELIDFGTCEHNI